MFRIANSSKKLVDKGLHNNYLDAKKDKNGKMLFKNGWPIVVKRKFEIYSCIGIETK